MFRYVFFTADVSISVVVRNGTVKPVSDYIASTGGWAAWSADVFVRKPVGWMYRTLLKQPVSWTYSKLFGDTNDTEDFCRPKTAQQIVASLPDNQFVFVDLIKVRKLHLCSLQFVHDTENGWTHTQKLTHMDATKRIISPAIIAL